MVAAPSLWSPARSVALTNRFRDGYRGALRRAQCSIRTQCQKAAQRNMCTSTRAQVSSTMRVGGLKSKLNAFSDIKNRFILQQKIIARARCYRTSHCVTTIASTPSVRSNKPRARHRQADLVSTNSASYRNSDEHCGNHARCGAEIKSVHTNYYQRRSPHMHLTRSRRLRMCSPRTNPPHPHSHPEQNKPIHYNAATNWFGQSRSIADHRPGNH